MNEDLNILILSSGTRNKIVQYFKKELGDRGSVIATDCSELAPALYDADKHYIVPRIDEDGYIEEILEICKKNKVKAVISLIDPELNLLAEHYDDFLSIGTTPILSSSEVIELCFDKFKMYEYLIQNDIPTVKSYIDKEKFYIDLNKGFINYPVFVKPVKGSASLNISKVNKKEELEVLYSKHDNLMIQEYMAGSEYGADVYIDMISGDLVSVFIKEKLNMRAGETDKSISIKDEKIVDLIIKLVEIIEFKGILDIDMFKVNDEYYISEVNPRFGGGYPHAYESGMNVPKMIINNISGNKNKESIGHYEEKLIMMKFSEVKVIKSK